MEEIYDRLCKVEKLVEKLVEKNPPQFVEDVEEIPEIIGSAEMRFNAMSGLNQRLHRNNANRHYCQKQNAFAQQYNKILNIRTNINTRDESFEDYFREYYIPVSGLSMVEDILNSCKDDLGNEFIAGAQCMPPYKNGNRIFFQKTILKINQNKLIEKLELLGLYDTSEEMNKSIIECYNNRANRALIEP